MKALDTAAFVVTLVTVGLLGAWRFAAWKARSPEEKPAVPPAQGAKAFLIIGLASAAGIGLGVYVSLNGGIGGIRVNNSVVVIVLAVTSLGLSFLSRRS